MAQTGQQEHADEYDQEEEQGNDEWIIPENAQEARNLFQMGNNHNMCCTRMQNSVKEWSASSATDLNTMARELGTALDNSSSVDDNTPENWKRALDAERAKDEIKKPIIPPKLQMILRLLMLPVLLTLMILRFVLQTTILIIHVFCSIISSMISWTAALAAFANPITHGRRRGSAGLIHKLRYKTLEHEILVMQKQRGALYPYRALFNLITATQFMNIFNNTQKSATSAAQKEKDAALATAHLPELAEGEAWHIADSGANRHYHVGENFMYQTEDADHDIGGMTGSGQATTRKLGIFAASLQDDSDIDHPVTSISFPVNNAEIGLFSEVQAAYAGNTIIHRGHPVTGTHGMILKGTGAFIPYHFDEESLLWWIKIKPAHAQHAAVARNTNLRDFCLAMTPKKIQRY